MTTESASLRLRPVRPRRRLGRRPRLAHCRGHGARVAVAEEYRVGGTCVIRGCVPKKLLVYGAHFAEDLDDAAMFGWDIPTRRFHWPTSARQRHGRGRPPRRPLRPDPLQPRRRPYSRIERSSPAPTRSASTTAAPSPPAKSCSPPEPVRAARHPRGRARHHLERGLPSRHHAQARGDRRRRLHRQRIRRRVPPAWRHVTIVNRSDTILRGYDEQIVDRLVKTSLAKGIDFRFNAALNSPAPGRRHASCAR